MRIVVFGGGGRIGRAVARDLATDPEVEKIGLVGLDPDELQRARVWIDDPRVELHVADVADAVTTMSVMKGYDAGVVTLPNRRASYLLLELAIEAGLSLVDVLEEFHRHPDAYEIEGLELPAGVASLEDYGEHLHRRAVAQGVILLDGMGLAPGLTNVTVGDALRRLDSADTAVARVGGIPEKAAAARHPLSYMITWAFEHVLREYVIRVNIRRDGEIEEVEAGADFEAFHFQQLDQNERLECAVTPGMPSFIYTRPELQYFAEKTVRWPGHWQSVATLKECGLLSLDPVDFGGTPVVPRKLLSSLLTPRLQPQEGETDVCVMYNTVTGTRGGEKVKIEHFMWQPADPALGLSAMMRTTAFPAAIAARMVARKQIPGSGIVAPEDGITGALYRDFLVELAKRQIVIHEETTPLA
jgi:lysine 6-dehydrogenase